MARSEAVGGARFPRWRAAAVLGAVLIVLGVVGARRVHASGTAAPPATRAPGRDASPPEVLGVGLLESVQEVPAAFEAPGRIASLLVEEGELVKAGQLLGTLDPASPQRRLRVAEGSLALARASVARAAADLARARVARAGVDRELARVRQLTADGASPQATLDQAADRASLAESDERALAAGLAQAQEAERVARDGVEVQRQLLAETRLVSPMDALVVKRHREPGHFVAAGAPVLTLASTRKLWVRAWVDETALSGLRPGQPARIEFRAEPGVDYPGRVDRVGRQADRQLHEVLVDVEVLRVPARFALGQRADVHIPTSAASAAVERPPGGRLAAREPRP